MECLVRHLAVTAAAVVLAGALAGCESPVAPEPKGPIKIGMIASLSGDETPWGAQTKIFVELAVAQLNEAGGADGHSIELVVEDDESAALKSVGALDSLARQNVVAVIGSSLPGAAEAAAAKVEELKIPYLSLAQLNGTTSSHSFGVSPGAAAFADTAFRYFKDTGLTRVLVAYQSDDFVGSAGRDAMAGITERNGVSIVASLDLTRTASPSALFEQATTSGAQAILVWSSDALAIALAKANEVAQPRLPIMFTGAQADDTYLEGSGVAGQRTLVCGPVTTVSAYLPVGPLRQSIDDLRGRYGKSIGFPPYQAGIDGAVAVSLLRAAIVAAGSVQPADIRNALEVLHVGTPLGRYRFSPANHSGLQAEYLTVNSIEAGNFVPTEWSVRRLAGIAGG
jgi:branched-chain amino acid transport system substrate-binding protein